MVGEWENAKSEYSFNPSRRIQRVHLPVSVTGPSPVLDAIVSEPQL
jgi:hypothetical protein